MQRVFSHDGWLPTKPEAEYELSLVEVELYMRGAVFDIFPGHIETTKPDTEAEAGTIESPKQQWRARTLACTTLLSQLFKSLQDAVSFSLHQE